VDLTLAYLPLGQGPQVVAPVTPALDFYAFASNHGELLDHGRSDRLLAGAIVHRLRSLGVCLCLVPDRREAGNALLKGRISQIGDTGLNGFVQPLETQIGFGGTPVEFGDVFSPAPSTLLAVIEN
jgi:hypothetical protein